MVVSPIAGTIKARIDANNLYFVTEFYVERDADTGAASGERGVD